MPSVESPQCDRILIFDENPVAGDDRIRMGRCLSDLQASQFLVFLFVGLENNQFGLGRQSEQNRASVNYGPETTSATGGISPSGLARFGIDAKKVPTLRESEKQSGFQHRRIELDRVFRVRPQLLCDKALALLLDFHRFGAAPLATVN